MHDGYIMRGARIVVPEKEQSIMLKVLHSSHSGVVNMKYVWWPGLVDTQIENMARQCFQCEKNRERTNSYTDDAMAISAAAMVSYSSGLCWTN